MIFLIQLLSIVQNTQLVKNSSDNTAVNVEGKNTVEVDIGDRFIIETLSGDGVGNTELQK